jgi:SpoIID/LytB domain protein
VTDNDVRNTVRLARRMIAAAATLGIAATAMVALPKAADAADVTYAVPASGAWTVVGRGYGHGRGMSQWGAQAQALQGRSADQILDFYYPGTVKVQQPAGTRVTVSLSAYAATSSVTVWVPTGSSIEMGNIGAEATVNPGRWTFTVSGQQVTAERRATPTGSPLETKSYSGVVRVDALDESGVVVAATPDATSGTLYRGAVRIEPTSGTAFNVTNDVLVDDYLQSVVPAEAYSSWAAAALQAQAVAARTYAQWKVDHGSALCDTTSCQVYKGRGTADVNGTVTSSNEASTTNAAVKATTGWLRDYQGAAAFTEFTSSNGGYSAAGDYPYLPAQADPYTGTAPGDTVSSWSATLPVSTVAAQCPSGGTLNDLAITSRTGNGSLGGRILQARVDCSTGSKVIATPSFGLKSSWWQPILLGDASYVPVTPTRIVDTRQSATPLAGGTHADVVVAGKAGVPAGASAVVVNVTATNTTFEGHLRVWPAGLPMPNTSVLNTDPSKTQASLVTVGLGADGAISIYNAIGSTDYLVDVLGYYTASGAGDRYTAVDPVRAFDSRTTGGKLTDGAPRTIDVAAALGVPAASLDAVTVNLTTASAAGAGYVVAFGSGALPTTSSVNLQPGADVANRAVVPVSGGKITLELKGASSDVIVDLNGWYGASAGALFTPIDPARVLDTRQTGPALGPAGQRVAPVPSSVVPGGATAIVGTLTATNQTAVVTHARMWPAGRPLTATSDLNSTGPHTQANAVIVRLGTGAAVSLYNDQGTSDLLLDVVGYFR